MLPLGCQGSCPAVRARTGQGLAVLQVDRHQAGQVGQVAEALIGEQHTALQVEHGHARQATQSREACINAGHLPAAVQGQGPASSSLLFRACLLLADAAWQLGACRSMACASCTDG